MTTWNHRCRSLSAVTISVTLVSHSIPWGVHLCVMQTFFPGRVPWSLCGVDWNRRVDGRQTDSVQEVTKDFVITQSFAF